MRQLQHQAINEVSKCFEERRLHKFIKEHKITGDPITLDMIEHCHLDNDMEDTGHFFIGELKHEFNKVGHVIIGEEMKKNI